MTYVYVASSWRCPTHPGVVDAIRAAGIDAYDFRNPEGGTGFSWRHVQPPAISAPVPACVECGGTRTYCGERCGCGPGVYHVADCSHPPRPCPACAGHAPPKGTDLVPAADYLAMIEHPRSIAGFAADFAAMERATHFVLVLPCGRSSHLELGWAVGTGKPSCVLLDDPVEPELMYRMVDTLARDVTDVIDWLGGMA
jgi:hypothetical protein